MKFGLLPKSVCKAWLPILNYVNVRGQFRLIAVRVPHLPKLRRSIPFTGTLVFTRTSHMVRVFLLKKKQSHGVTAPWLYKKGCNGVVNVLVSAFSW